MDFSKLITRAQYEKVARAQGLKTSGMTYSQLEQLAQEAFALNRTAYKALSQREAR